MDLNKIIESLRTSFHSDEAKKVVLDDFWYEKNISSKIDSTGFCYPACEIIYRLTGGKDNWTIKVISKKDWIYGSHYLLVDKKTNDILDITSDQYTSLNIDIPYEKGKGVGLRAKSKKAQFLSKIIGIEI